LAPDMLANQSF